MTSSSSYRRRVFLVDQPGTSPDCCGLLDVHRRLDGGCSRRPQWEAGYRERSDERSTAQWLPPP